MNISLAKEAQDYPKQVVDEWYWQEFPVQPFWHVQTPVPVNPSLHDPALAFWLQGPEAPAAWGHAAQTKKTTHNFNRTRLLIYLTNGKSGLLLPEVNKWNEK
jgi:hypothetical protein